MHLSVKHADYTMKKKKKKKTKKKKAGILQISN